MNKTKESKSGERQIRNDIKWRGHKGRVYGATMHRKNKDCLRLVFGNINTLPKEKNRHYLRIQDRTPCWQFFLYLSNKIFGMK